MNAANYRKRESQFAASTLAATAYLIRFAPERLKAWIDKHPAGKELERETRDLIAEKARRRRASNA